MQVSPGQSQDDEFDEPMGGKAFEIFERNLGSETFIQQIQDKRKKEKHQCTTDPVQDRHISRKGQSIVHCVRQLHDAKLLPIFGYGIRHNSTSLSLTIP